ncbi:MAG TPA: TVP38/TMEM64 family protein, partial [Thermodesulfovibrionales bacterium]|nr:TVP38/TMEM64 family protein [Thermodesulfovibrionales bacterium]
MKKRLFILVLIAGLSILVWLNAHQYLTFENLKAHRELLQRYVAEHYLLSAAVFVAYFVSTALLVPGAVASTVAGGFLFGVVMGAIYVNIGAAVGSALAFLSSRFLIGNWVQKRYGNHLKRFNEEIEEHGLSYLFTLRIVPALPFFVTNYLAGMTKIPLRKFMLVTVLGTIPGSIVY